MKTMTEQELDQWVLAAQSLKGFELRQFRYDEKVLQTQWFNGDRMVWVTLSMSPGVPFVFSTEERIPLVTNQKKPLSLFVKTHCLGREWISVEREKSLGRVIQINLQGSCHFRFVLIPGRVNIEIQANGKTIYANKPQDLPEQEESAKEALNREPRSRDSFLQHWLKAHDVRSGKSESPSSKKLLKKKTSGLQKMQQHLAELKDSPWQALGEWLKEHQDLETVPKEWVERIDPRESLAWNIENCFKQAKKNQNKIQGTEDRLQVLAEEIEKIEAGKVIIGQKKSPPSLLNVANLKGRTIPLAEGRFFVGKSGKENVQLLRKAKPWYLWLHIKDFPGAYGIVERNKGQKVSQDSLSKAALAVVRQSLPKGASGQFEVIYAECRYVRPIKGAKAGQVTYSHEKVLPIKVSE